jgi:predicted RND superfamily exporter protein
MLIVIVETKHGDIYNSETIQKIDNVTRGLMKIDGVLPGGITSLTRGVTHYENTSEGLAMDPILGRRWPQTEEEFKKLKRKVAVNPMGLGRYVSYDGTATMITATLADEKERAKRSYEQLSDEEKAVLSLEEHESGVKAALMESLLKGVEGIESKEKDARHNLYFNGPQLIEAQMTSMGGSHIPVAAAVMFVLIVVALVIRFRTLQGVSVPVVAMVFSLLWSMGMLGASGIDFHPMPLTFPLILGLFSLAYGVLVLEGYRSSYEGIGDKGEAIGKAYTMAPAAASMLTAGLAIGCLFVTNVPMLKGLAWLGLFWLLGTAVVVLVLLPALMSLLPAPGRSKPGRDSSQSGSAASPELSPGKGRSLLLVLLVAILLIGGFCATKLEVGDNVPGSSYIRPGHPWNQCFQLMAEKFMGPYQLLVYGKAREEGGLLDPEAVNAIGDFSRYLRHQCGARDAIAFDMMVNSARHMLMDGNPKWQIVPLSREQVQGMGELVVEQGGVESFIDKTFTEATISPFFPEEDMGHIEEYVSMMQTYIDQNPSEKIDFRLGGGLLGMIKVVNDGTRHAYWKTLAVAFGLVFLCGILVTGSLLWSFAATLPIAAAQGVVWMIMTAAGMKINMPVTVVSAAAIGFCSVFGFSLVRKIGAAPDGSDRQETDVRPGPEGAGGVVLFLGVLLFAASLPWFFIGLRFPSQMVLALGTTVLLAAVLSALLVPAFVGPCKGGSPR